MPFILDIFNSNAFGVIELTDRVNRIPQKPGRLGELGIFTNRPVRTTTIAIEDRDGKLVLVPTTPRGGVGNQFAPNKRNLRKFDIPHIELNDTIPASEVQNIRTFGGQADEMESVQQIVDERLAEMTDSLDVTLEHHRMGAVRGIVYDADGSTVIYNLFTEFGKSQTSIDMNLGVANEDIIPYCMDIHRATASALGAAPYRYIHALCGPDFFDKLIAADTVKEAYKYFQATGQTKNPLRDDLRSGFVFGGILWEEYYGTVGSVDSIPDAEAQAFPVGVPGLFNTYYAPADFVEAANTMGLPRYAKVVPDPSGLDKFVGVHVQTNPLSICTRPEALIKLTTSDS